MGTGFEHERVRGPEQVQDCVYVPLPPHGALQDDRTVVVHESTQQVYASFNN